MSRDFRRLRRATSDRTIARAPPLPVGSGTFKLTVALAIIPSSDALGLLKVTVVSSEASYLPAWNVVTPTPVPPRNVMVPSKMRREPSGSSWPTTPEPRVRSANSHTPADVAVGPAMSGTSTGSSKSVVLADKAVGVVAVPPAGAAVCVTLTAALNNPPLLTRTSASAPSNRSETGTSTVCAG
jgi:hypothetical protein